MVTMSFPTKPRFGVEPVSLDDVKVEAPFCPHGESSSATSLTSNFHHSYQVPPCYSSGIMPTENPESSLPVLCTEIGRAAPSSSGQTSLSPQTRERGEGPEVRDGE